tara:strand:- start:565 stop:1242 length:678 start_codon:yes stop_codon:yes gene_type:complete
MKMPKIVVYQYLVSAERKDDKLEWCEETISKLLLGFPWREAMNSYNKRAKFYFGFNISGHGDELFPIIDAKVELHRASLQNPQFLIEVATMPNKLTEEHRKALSHLLDDRQIIEDQEFKIWWDHDPRGPRKRKLKDKEKIILDIKAMPAYAENDDLKMEDAEVSIHEALQFFGYEAHASKKDVRDSFKSTYRGLQLKFHPDSETGNEESFLFLQKCHNLLKKWIR